MQVRDMAARRMSALADEKARAGIARRIRRGKAGLRLSDTGRPLRFAATGGLAGGLAALIQLGLLTFLAHNGWIELLANALAKARYAADVPTALPHWCENRRAPLR
jgi:hypothetical protein